MAYVRRKQVKGRSYYQVVESYRDGGKPRQRVIAHLGPWPSIEEAIDGWRMRAELWAAQAHRLRQKIGATEEQRQAYYEQLPGRRIQIPHWTDRCRESVQAGRWNQLDIAIGYERSAAEALRKVEQLEAIAAGGDGPLCFSGQAPEYELDIKAGLTVGGYVRLLSGFNRYTAGVQWTERSE